MTPERLQSAHLLVGALLVGEQHALGDLDLEAFGGEAAFLQHVAHDLDDVAVVDLRGRDVDGDVDAGPRLAVLDRAPHDELADVLDEAGLFGERNEDLRATPLPSSGSVQRASASTPSTWLPLGSMSGW